MLSLCLFKVSSVRFHRKKEKSRHNVTAKGESNYGLDFMFSLCLFTVSSVQVHRKRFQAVSSAKQCQSRITMSNPGPIAHPLEPRAVSWRKEKSRYDVTAKGESNYSLDPRLRVIPLSVDRSDPVAVTSNCE